MLYKNEGRLFSYPIYKQLFPKKNENYRLNQRIRKKHKAQLWEKWKQPTPNTVRRVATQSEGGPIKNFVTTIAETVTTIN